MLLAWMVRQTDKETYRIANVKLACNIGKDKFLQNIFIGETFLRDNLFGLGCLLRWSFESCQAVGYCRLDGNRHRTFMREREIGPTAASSKPINSSWKTRGKVEDCNFPPKQKGDIGQSIKR